MAGAGVFGPLPKAALPPKQLHLDPALTGLGHVLLSDLPFLLLAGTKHGAL